MYKIILLNALNILYKGMKVYSHKIDTHEKLKKKKRNVEKNKKNVLNFRWYKAQAYRHILFFYKSYIITERIQQFALNV